MPTLNEPFVSVVTPVYNRADVLGEAIESVLSQNYPFHEYIILDNCSTDGSYEIASSLAERDPRIRLMRNPKFLPTMQNQNLALAEISEQSEYCKVLHADYILFPECLTEMVEVARAYPTAGLIGSYCLHGNRVTQQGVTYPDRLHQGKTICRRTLLEPGFYVFGNLSNLLVRSDLIRSRKPFYTSLLLGDVDACFAVLQGTDFGFVHQVLTLTCEQHRSITSTHDSPDKNPLRMLNVVINHGSKFLDTQEYKTCLDMWLSRYYRFLGRNHLQRRDKEFWDYQKNGLATLGMTLNGFRVRISAAKILLANNTHLE